MGTQKWFNFKWKQIPTESKHLESLIAENGTQAGRKQEMIKFSLIHDGTKTLKQKLCNTKNNSPAIVR